MSPIKLSDAELTAVFDAARPLPVERRDGFLQSVANSLASLPEVGPGAVFRVVSEQQRRFFEPPDLSAARDQSKYR